MKRLFSLILGVLLITSITHAGARDDFKGSVNTLILSVGTANYKAYMNSAGNQFEWATGVKIGSFTIDLSSATADTAYTGIGFKPTLIEFIVSFGQGHSIGLDDASNHFSNQVVGVGAGIEYTTQATRSIFATDNYGVTNRRGYVKTLDSDGFTLSWDTAGAVTGTATILYKAYR